VVAQTQGGVLLHPTFRRKGLERKPGREFQLTHSDSRLRATVSGCRRTLHSQPSCLDYPGSHDWRHFERWFRTAFPINENVFISGIVRRFAGLAKQHFVTSLSATNPRNSVPPRSYWTQAPEAVTVTRKAAESTVAAGG